MAGDRPDVRSDVVRSGVVRSGVVRLDDRSDDGSVERGVAPSPVTSRLDPGASPPEDEEPRLGPDDAGRDSFEGTLVSSGMGRTGKPKDPRVRGL